MLASDFGDDLRGLAPDWIASTSQVGGQSTI
jgi:hypothetical protein